MPEISKIFCFDIAHTFCSFLNSFIGKSWTYFSFSNSTVPVVFGLDKMFVNKCLTALLAFCERLLVVSTSTWRQLSSQLPAALLPHDPTAQSQTRGLHGVQEKQWWGEESKFSKDYAFLKDR